MKKYIMAILTLVLSLSISVPLYAAMPAENGLADEIKNLEEDIILNVSDIVKAEGYDDDPEKTQVRFDETEKVYVDTEIETLEQTDLGSVTSQLEKSAYVYVVPVYTEKHFFTVTLSKVSGEGSRTGDNVLTEADMQYLSENAGKWHVAGISIPLVKNYADTVSQIENETGYHNIYLIGGIPGIQMPIALVCDDDEAVGFADIGYSAAYLEELTENTDSRAIFSGSSKLLYEYAAVIDSVNDYKETISGETLSEGMGSIREDNIILFETEMAAVCVIAVLGMAIIIYKKRQWDK